MSDWLPRDWNRVIIHSGGEEGVGQEVRTQGGLFTTSNTWPAANRAIFIPFVVFNPFTALLMMVKNGSAVSGNIDVGIYDTEGDRLVSKGSTAQAGTSAIQSFDITDTTLEPGVYYMAVAMDNTTGALLAAGATQNQTVAGCSAMGILSQSTAFALPSPATFAAAQDAYVPAMAITGRTLI